EECRQTESTCLPIRSRKDTLFAGFDHIPVIQDEFRKKMFQVNMSVQLAPQTETQEAGRTDRKGEKTMFHRIDLFIFTEGAMLQHHKNMGNVKFTEYVHGLDVHFDECGAQSGPSMCPEYHLLRGGGRDKTDHVLDQLDGA